MSRLDRRSTRAAGLALTPTPFGAESSRRERGVLLLWVAVFSNVETDAQASRSPAAGHPFATDTGGME